MNIIKFCELEEVSRSYLLGLGLTRNLFNKCFLWKKKFEERKRSSNKELDLEILLSKIKLEIDSLLQESPSNNKVKSTANNFSNEFDCYLNDDMKMLIESYEKCSRKLNDLNEKSQIKGRLHIIEYIEKLFLKKVLIKMQLKMNKTNLRDNLTQKSNV